MSRNLRADLIRVAFENEDLRDDLIPLLKQAGRQSLDDRTLDQLVEMAAASAELDNWRDAEATREVHRLADRFEKAVEQSLAKWVKANPEALEEGYDEDDLFDEEGPYNILMTLMGHGVGIWDGRWDHFFADRSSIKDLERHLKKDLGSWADDTGSGKLPAAFLDAAYETAGGEEE